MGMHCSDLFLLVHRSQIRCKSNLNLKKATVTPPVTINAILHTSCGSHNARLLPQIQEVVLETFMAVACTLRCHTMEAAFSCDAVEEQYSAEPRRAQSSHFSFDDPAATGSAASSSRKRQTERCPIMRELEAAACREGTLLARSTRTEVAMCVSRRSDPEVGRRRRQPYYAGDLREAAKQLAIATMNCEDYMQRVTMTSC